MIQGTFVSIWDNDIEISTPAKLNEKTGEIISESVDVENLDLEILIDEYFIDSVGVKYSVCPECHEYIIINNTCTNLNCK
jgi:hypothetical protein